MDDEVDRAAPLLSVDPQRIVNHFFLFFSSGDSVRGDWLVELAVVSNVGLWSSIGVSNDSLRLSLLELYVPSNVRSLGRV
jgi:hypothetical protein